MDEKLLGKIADHSSEEHYKPFPEGYKIGRTKYVIITGSVISGIGKGIFSSALGNFPSNSVSLYGNKTIQVSGLIRMYQGHPEIIANNPNQIVVLK